MAYITARRLNIASARRNIFLDVYPDEKYILSQLHNLKALALKTGHAIGIGHPYTETARAIESFKRVLNESGIFMVHVSRLIPA